MAFARLAIRRDNFGAPLLEAERLASLKGMASLDVVKVTLGC